MRPPPPSLWTFLAQVTGAGGPAFAPAVQGRRWRGLRALGRCGSVPPGAQAAMALCWSMASAWEAPSQARSCLWKPCPATHQPACGDGSRGGCTGQSPLGRGSKEMALSGQCGVVKPAAGTWGQASYPIKPVAQAACLPVTACPPGSSGQLGWAEGLLETCFCHQKVGLSLLCLHHQLVPCPQAVDKALPWSHDPGAPNPPIIGALAQANPVKTELGTQVTGSPGPPPWSRAPCV